mmetsp:Transcript_96068/g.200694  ORF Transcript_96068/g.200694 Transcript_96068/m.200694 type:complete len:611 (+) Transcript_96068:190-2022(+)|eukprot:CAMPEP_0206425090 /NCGR_PEP_ID=MMETSP0324_2-20121206/3596_1 /ASSEMBLY_ACC=CAM_ASM_000836 /TAXON_ID=2866 /ORGANISM="Crypthecodinium cohnii, Strain Seligo" /LENGTH=610 /DNA_ID=CAMNT_0053889829 /DNA_START=120 /DNA_END=1952 /DNA_ORIENTATION=+
MAAGEHGGEYAAADEASYGYGQEQAPFEVGEVVVYGDGKTGYITRAYPLEDKFAIKAVGAPSELRGPDNSFFYFRAEELLRAVPLPREAPADAEVQEPALKKSRTTRDAEAEALEAKLALKPGRFEGKVKWWSKEKGFGKILPIREGGKPPDAPVPSEEVFLHRNQCEGGGEGPHAGAVEEGTIVTYEVTTHYDGKPCACNVQVPDVVRAMATAPKHNFGQKAELIRRLLASGMQTGVYQVIGVGKANMEDRFVIRSGIPVDSLGMSCKKAVVALFGVFDGHSGASCSDFVSTNLERSLFDCIRHQSRRDVTSDMAMRSALLAAFRMTEHNYFQYLNKLEGGAAHAWATAGSTACTAAFFGPDEEGRLRLAVANAGDSRVVMGRRDATEVRMSQDHTPEVPTERRRIEQEGSSVVNASGIWRIVLPSKRGLGIAGLSVSRGFGDLEYKQPSGVVSAVPDVTLTVLDLHKDSFLIFASDGVWGPVSDSDAVRIVAGALREATSEPPAKYAARVLVEEAHRRDGNDDKTAVIVWFGDMPQPPPAVSATPQLNSATRMQPRQVMVAASRGGGGGGGDDMFAIKQPLSMAQSIAQDYGVRPMEHGPSLPGSAYR